MIQEAYCSYEVSKLLKEKGFDELCNKKYNSYKSLVFAGKITELWQKNSEFDIDEECSAPTQQMAMRWLREVHDIKIMIRPYVDGTYSYEILNGFWYVNFDSYEDAAEEAIKYCLEYLI